MFTGSPVFYEKNTQQVQEIRVVAPRVESKTIVFQKIPRQFCSHGYNAGMCPGCGASE
jgi:hypothetical protein